MKSHPLVKKAREKMEKSVESIRTELNHLRTGRPSAALLEEIKVDYYGNPTPVSQLSTISVSEGRTLVVKPWDKSLIGSIEKAIQASDLGINPSNDGSVIRLAFPSPTTEQRKQLAKKAKSIVEDGKVAVRNVRREIMKEIKEKKESGEFPEDDAKSLENEVQKVTDEYVKKLDDIYEEKEKEIMEF
ncbi:ribosome recycling factor [Mesoaciditoga sp.]